MIATAILTLFWINASTWKVSAFVIGRPLRSSRGRDTETLKFVAISNKDTFSEPNDQARRHNRDQDFATNKETNMHDRELFSVAPLMGHTNRHYRYFFRLLSQRSHLYTEMVPSAQIVRAYRRARDVYLGPKQSNSKSGFDDVADEDLTLFHPEEILEVISRLKDHPEKEFQLHDKDRAILSTTTLGDLLGLSDVVEYPVVLQLGGNNPKTLASAAAIGKAFSNYDSINLNCGCPSIAVGGRSGGVALMKDPSLVARCVESMNQSLISLTEVSESHPSSNGKKECPVTIKHRLGARDAVEYDAMADRQKGDTEAFETCRSFVKTISLGGAVAKCHVHARLGLLGEFQSQRQQLWVPGMQGTSSTTRSDHRVKVDHNRVQERAKKRAREATIKNRDIPPLRPNVVRMLAEEFPDIEFVSNGGIKTLSEVERIVDDGWLEGKTNPIGAMVGRAVVNHPCSFASADILWNLATMGHQRRPSRGEVLQKYIDYCDREEERVEMLVQRHSLSIEYVSELRKRLAAVPFHLFTGEEGSDAFQRIIKKLAPSKKDINIKASSILLGAMSFVPSETLDKCVDDYIPWDEIPIYDGYRRSSSMNRVVY